MDYYIVVNQIISTHLIVSRTPFSNKILLSLPVNASSIIKKTMH